MFSQPRFKITDITLLQDLPDSTKDAEGDELKDIYSAYKHDDLALLSELYSSIEANVPNIRSKRM